MNRTTTRRNIELVMTWLDAMRRKDLDDAVACFAPEVVWTGLAPGVECPNRNAVRDMLAQSLEQEMDVDGVELIAGEGRVALGVRSPELQELAGVVLNGQLFNVFTVSDHRIVDVRDFATRGEALRAAGIRDSAGWQ